MSAKRLKVLISASLLVIGTGAAAQPPSSPIIDVRIDEAYRDVPYSKGDEWAPTWAQDDHLYTGNNDGHSFGGVPFNTITFGKLEGDHPDKLKGTTLNGMQAFAAQRRPGPEGALWKVKDSIQLGSAFYRLSPCADDAGSTCLSTSRDAARNWQSVKMATDQRLPGFSFVELSTAYDAIMAMNEGKAAGQYVYAAAHDGLIDGEDHYYLARQLRKNIGTNVNHPWQFKAEEGWTPDLPKAKPIVNFLEGIGPDNANWKLTNSYSVDGTLYLWITRCLYPAVASDEKLRHVWFNSSIIKSTDGGKSWSRSAEENYRRPMFPGQRFGTPYFIWYGKDGAGSADNADKYVYAISNDGYFEAGDNFVLGRVERSKLADLNAKDWSFYQGGDGMQVASWTRNLDEAKPVLENPGKANMAGVTYLPALQRYVMVGWHYKHGSFQTAIRRGDISTTLEFFEAPTPWGPWKLIKTLPTGKLNWFAPIIGQKFQSSGKDGSVWAWLYVSRFDAKPNVGTDLTNYKLHFMPVTFSTKPLKHADPDFAGGH